MLFGPCSSKKRSRLRSLLGLLAIVSIFGVFFVHYLPFPRTGPHVGDLSDKPLVREYIAHGTGRGGRWYIPSSWLAMAAAAGGPSSLISSTKPQTVLEAAQLVLELSIRNRKFARNSKIPLVAHQTWKSLTPETWSPMIQESVEGWLNASTGVSTPGTPEMAYILWDDEGIESLIKQYEPKLWEGFKTLPYPVEKADTFRVAVVRWFGGYYADVDVNLIQHPSQFVQNDDLTEWRDPVTDHTFGLQTSKSKRYQPPDTAPEPYQQVLALFKNPTLDVGAIYGIEADTPPNKDDYWRMGYSYPVQITNWALAAAPQHPTTARYLEDLDEAVKLNSSRLHDVDPLDLTGPPALTKSVKGYCEELNPEFRWYGLSGREDPPGGRGKIIASDTLILPITGFSPGRGWMHNMGSQPVSHPNARLKHAAAGSWRKLSVQVQMGKLCRTVFGGCRDWKKIP